MKALCFLTYAALFLLLTGMARAEAPDAFPDLWAEVAERYRTAAERQGVVGSSLYFIQGGEVLAAEHFGFADKASGRPVDADTIYHWASITKTFTAAAAMQLVERRLISLDDPVSDYLPEIRKAHNPHGSSDAITLRHLITHSSGLRNPTFPWGGDQDWHPFEPTEWSQVAAMMPYTEIQYKPGSRYAYSNPGLSMLGRVVEEVSGDDIEVYIAKNIFMPLGMTRSYFDITPYHLLGDRSNNYLIVDSAPAAQGLDFDTGATTGNGGLNAPVGDMAKWLNFWLGVGDNGNYDMILRRKTLEAMWKPVLPANDPGMAPQPEITEHVGQVFFLTDHAPAGGARKRRYVGHTGDQKAFTVFIYVDPATNAAAIFANNTVDPEIADNQLLRFVTRADLFESIFPLFADWP